MKKIIFLALLVMVAPAMATDVDFSAVQEGSTPIVRIYYDSNTPPGPLPRAFALDITVDNGQTIDAITDYHEGESVSGDKGHGIFPGSIDINSEGDINDVGTPVADPCQLPSDTQGGLDTNGITIEMGSLYVGSSNAPDPCALLCKIEVSGDCNLTVAGNVGRGKVVMEGAGQGLTNLPITIHVTLPSTYTIAGSIDSNAPPIKDLNGVTLSGLPGSPVTDANGDYSATVTAGWSGTVTPTKTQWTFTPKTYSNVQADATSEDYKGFATECLASTDPGYAFWAGAIANKPDCWCYRRQCRGDANGTNQGPYWVGSFDLTILKGAINKLNAQVPAGGFCADFNHTPQGPYRVGSFDLGILKTYINKLVGQVPECDSTNINEWKN